MTEAQRERERERAFPRHTPGPNIEPSGQSLFGIPGAGPHSVLLHSLVAGAVVDVDGLGELMPPMPFPFPPAPFAPP
jgi:hypothetical protein